MNRPSTPNASSVPGCAPQAPEAERLMGSGINPANTWAAAMALVQPQAGVATEHPFSATNKDHK